MVESGRLARRRLLRGLGAAAACGPLLLTARRSGGAGAAASIHQRIWDADQAANGLRALRAGERGDPARGYVVVAETSAREPAHRLFTEVRIPDRKRRTYDLARALFDNYRLDQTKQDVTTPEEARELLALLDAVGDSPPMAVARAHVEELEGRRLSHDQWQERIFEVWIRPFDLGRNLDLSGFEHVMVGEQRGGRVSGYHFWYKYHLDDDPDAEGGDAIDFDGTRYDGPGGAAGRLTAIGQRVPQIVTLAYRWFALDQASGERRPLFEPIGGFFVGCSVEGLMALGMVRFAEHGEVSTVIEGARYGLDLHRSPDGRSLRSFFPRLQGLA